MLNMEPIAIVGTSCRLPGAADVHEYWSRISARDSKPAFREVPPSRWDSDTYYHPDFQKPGCIYQKKGGFLDDIEYFNWSLFGLHEEEARRMDPQQRLALELAWQAAEMANLKRSELRGSRTGVYAALSHADQKWKIDADLALIHAENAQSAYRCFVANRISYVFDLQGPSVSFDSACSSGLAALHAACHALLRREIDTAFVGAFNLFLTPHEWISSSAAGTLSRSGNCRPFDERADGFMRSEGAVMLLLMRADAALAQDRDILGYIRDVRLNHNGKSNGICAPKGSAVARLIAEALAATGLRADEIDYYDAHATGTPLGDAIEVRAADMALESAGRKRKCVLGSVKADIGHTEAASAFAGLLKVLLCLAHEVLFSCSREVLLNPHLAGRLHAFEVAQRHLHWPAANRTRHAMISALGLGGSNGLAVVAGPELQRAARPAASAEASRPEHLVLRMSAPDHRLLRAAAHACAGMIDAAAGATAAEICHAVSVRGGLYEKALVITAASPRELSSRLRAIADAEASDALQHPEPLHAHVSSSGSRAQANGSDPRQASKREKAQNIERAGDDRAYWKKLYGARASPLRALPVAPLCGSFCWCGPWRAA